jgi:hypothetical protein
MKTNFYALCERSSQVMLLFAILDCKKRSSHNLYFHANYLRTKLCLHKFAQRSSYYKVRTTKFAQRSSYYKVRTTKFAQQSSHNKVRTTRFAQQGSHNKVRNRKFSYNKKKVNKKVCIYVQ